MKFRKIDISRILPIRKHKESAPMPDNTTDKGNEPALFNLCREARMNESYRKAIWTGKYMQLTLMTLEPGEDTGVEMHEGGEQLLRVEEGEAIISMGKSPDSLEPSRRLGACSAALIPSGTYHLIKSVGVYPLRLTSIYAPPAHRWGTVDEEKT